MKNESILRGTVFSSIVLSIINYYGIFVMSLVVFGVLIKGSNLSGYAVVILINIVYLLAIYLEFKAYKTGKRKYLILPFIISFVTITPPILATIIKLILLTTIARLIKKTSKENNEIAKINKEDLGMIFGLNVVATVITYFFFTSLTRYELKNNENIVIAITLLCILSVYLEFKAYKTKKIIYLSLSFVISAFSVWINVIKIILLMYMAGTIQRIKNKSKESIQK